jgi:hypothetical protein
MKNKLTASALALAVSLTGCAHVNSGIRYYEPLVTVDKKGVSHTNMRLKASLAVDMPGLQTLTIGDIRLDFNSRPITSSEAIYDRRGNFVEVMPTSYLPGLYPSHTIESQGVATAKIIDSAAAAATGTLLSIGGGIASGGLITAVPKP